MILAELPVTTELIELLTQYTSGIGNISNSFIYKRKYLNCPKDLLKLIIFLDTVLPIVKRPYDE